MEISSHTVQSSSSFSVQLIWRSQVEAFDRAFSFLPSSLLKDSAQFFYFDHIVDFFDFQVI